MYIWLSIFGGRLQRFGCEFVGFLVVLGFGFFFEVQKANKIHYFKFVLFLIQNSSFLTAMRQHAKV